MGASVGDHVIFWNTDTLEVGTAQILFVPRISDHEYAYLLGQIGTNISVQLTEENWRTVQDSHRDTIFYTRERFVAPYNEKNLKRAKRYLELREKSKLFAKSTDIHGEVLRAISGKIPSTRLQVYFGYLKEKGKVALKYLAEVILLGIVWIPFGSIVRLFLALHRRYVLDQEIHVTEQDYHRKKYLEELMNLGKNQGNLEQKLLELKQSRDMAEAEVNEATNSTLSLLFSVAGLIISVYALLAS